MRVIRWIGAALLLGVVGTALLAGEGPAADTNRESAADTRPASEVSLFDDTISPLLSRRCLECHSGEEPKGKLDLTDEALVRQGGESGPAVTPGKPDESLLWEYVESDQMPPEHPLPEVEKHQLLAWIAAGAKWGAGPIDPLRATTDRRAGYDWWSLQPVERPDASSVANAKWVRNPIDAFVLAELEKRGLEPRPEADRTTLIRRLSFDLTGLPPTPEEVEAFVADTSTDSYEQLVERLLASPRYGERWARHWLDLAQFGESDGFEYDRMRPNAWRYRDWVIKALNADMPYDEFAKLQIAGDVLRPGEAPATVATGYLVAGPHDSLKPAFDTMQKIMRQDELEVLVGQVSQTFLGLTVHCARCHDHKFDPIRQTDYFRLAAALAGVHRGDRSLAASDQLTALQSEVDEASAALRAFETPLREQIVAARSANLQSPVAYAAWQFGRGLESSREGLAVELVGEAKQTDAGLVLDGSTGYALTTPLDKDLDAKTLEAWITLDTTEQGGGAALSLQTLDGATFDAIVYGEREAGRWISGSDFYRRTQPLAAPPEQKPERVHVAISYDADGTIAVYRNGQPYGAAYQSGGVQKFEKGKSQLLFGLRHKPAEAGRLLRGTIHAAGLYDRALSAAEVAASYGIVSDVVTDDELQKALSPEHARQWTDLRQSRDDGAGRLDALRGEQAYSITPHEQPPPTHRLVRGSPSQPAELIAPGGLALLQGEWGMPADAPDAVRRARLAEWIASDESPLFARTMVNRLWQYHFGQGLVLTPSDLGFSGGQPSHPDLLDWLAVEFREHDYSLKHMHRLMVISATYRQASTYDGSAAALDADNRLLWRYSPRRLDAESIRDSMLSAAGQLNLEMGGPSYQDFRPHVRGGTQFYEPQDFDDAEHHRRSIYRMWARGGQNPLLATFDCPDPSTTTPRRGSTTTPLQSLSLMNNAFVARMANYTAEQVQAETSEPSEQAASALERIYARPATPEEQQLAAAFVNEHGLPAFCRVLFNTNAFLYVR